MKKINIKNPWLGLETYQEGQILYGRDSDIRNLSQYILNNTETLLYGKSGIGKSSILNAAILPAMRRNGYLPVKIQLFHKDDSKTYLHQINSAIIDAILDSQNHNTHDEDETLSENTDTECNKIDTSSLIREVVSCKNPEEESIYEYFHRHTFHNVDGTRIKLLIIFDQFEEIFTLQEDIMKRKLFFSQCAHMLNNIMPHELQPQDENSSESRDKIKIETESDFKNILGKITINFETTTPNYVTDNEIHFVFTIREDYLSEFEYYSAQIPSLKHNRYGLRPLNEEQAFQIILQPVAGLVSKNVAHLIIEKITGKKDFKLNEIPEIEVDAAVLSLYLSRLYEAKEGSYISQELVEHKDSLIISDFYNDAISDKRISSTTIEYLEDKLLNSQDHRDNITIKEAIDVGKISKEELEILCKEKKILRRFFYAGVLRIEYVHDKLCPVIASNKRDRIERRKYEEQKRRERELRRQRVSAYIIIFILVSIIASWFIAYQMPLSYRYASVTKEWGRFVGIEELSKYETSYRDYHFVLKKKGLFTKTFSSLECRDKFGNLSTNHGLSTYITPGTYEDSILDEDLRRKLGMVCQWEFVKDPLDKEFIIQERAYDAYHNLIYAFNYNKPQNIHSDNKDKKKVEDKQNFLQEVNDKKTRIGSYVDAQGLPLNILKEGYRFVRISYDDEGHDMLVEYFDWDGNPSNNTDGAFQTYYEYNNNGQTISMFSLNMYGKRMIDNAGNSGMIFKYDGFRKVESLSVDEFGREKAVNDGYSRETCEYDEHGRITKLTYWNKNMPAYNKEGTHIVKILYDDNNNRVTAQLYNITGSSEQIAIVESRFDTQGNMVYYMKEITNKEKHIIENKFDLDGNTIFNKEINIEGTDTTYIFTYEKKDTTEIRKLDKIINKTIYDHKGRIIEDAYYELDGKTPFISDSPYQRTVHTYTDDGRDDKDIYKMVKDSIVEYNNDKISYIQVIKYWPNLGYKETSEYYVDKTTLIYSITNSWLDVYNNTTEEHHTNRNNVDGEAYYFINAKNNLPNGNAMYLTPYKFPMSDTKYYDLGRSRSLICNENGDTTVTSDYMLPDIYSGERNKNAIFMTCYHKGRRWHSVLLASSSGFSWGDNNRKVDGNDNVLCLNLTTMRVEEISLDDLDFWRIYDYYITQIEYDIYQEHYTNYKKTKEYDIFQKTCSPNAVVYGEITGDKGYLVEQGLTGCFFVLQWNNWNCTQSQYEFEEEFNAVKELPKDIVLLPFKIEDEKILYGDVLIHLKDLKGLLGLHLQSEEIDIWEYQENVIDRYKKYMKEKQ